MIAWIPVLLLAAAASFEVNGISSGPVNSLCANASEGEPLDNEHVYVQRDEEISLEENCRINSVTNLTIEGSPGERPTVRCTRNEGIASVGFVFTNVTSLVVRNVNFESCGGVLTAIDLAHYPDDSFFNFSAGHAAVILCSFCKDLVLENVTFTNNTGYAFAAINLLGSSYIDSILLDGKNDPHLPYNATICNHPEYQFTCGFRGMLILFIDSDQHNEPEGLSTLQISNSIFDSNYDAPLDETDDPIRFECIKDVFDEFYLQKQNSDIPDVGAMTIVYNQANFRAQVDVLNSNFTNNRGTCFGAVLVLFSLNQTSHGRQTFENCNFYNNSPLVGAEGLGWSHIGADVTLYMEFHGSGDETDCIAFRNSSFISSGYYWDMNFPSISMTHFPVTEGACTLNMENIWTNVSIRLLYATGVSQGTSASAYLKDIRMIDHHASHDYLKSTTENFGLLTFAYVGNVTLEGTSSEMCRFHNLIGPVFVVRASKLYLTGEMIFENIVASKWAYGAAIMLQVDSGLWFKEPLNATFYNNSALFGGAIGADQLTIEFCVLLYEPLECVNEYNVSSLNITILFNQNSADLAGNSIYMDKLYSCSTHITPKIRLRDILLLYNSTFEFINEVDNGLLEMSSFPSETCICNGELNDTSSINCARNSLNVSKLTVYPGQTFSIDIIVVDEIRNPVYSSVYSDLLAVNATYGQTKKNWELGYGQNLAIANGGMCTRLNFTIYYLANDSSLINGSDGTLAIYPHGQQQCVAIPVTVKKCPLGFGLTGASCDCDEMLKLQGFTNCNIDNGTITKPQNNYWIGDFSGSLAYSPHCPSKYCYQVAKVNVTDFNSSCKYNRYGVLCGRCSGDLSSVFGDPDCHICSNYWLLTIPLYAVAGILLVIALFALRLTVAAGTITVVILYANIFNVNTFYFLGYKSTLWLRIFISWLNLELGFPVCFFHKMTDLDSTYLSFIIPVYLWLIVLTIIFLSRYFQRISDLTSRSAVPVLATLIQLSFSRLLRLVVDGMIFASLDVKDQGSQTVWYFDGNIRYFCKERIGLLLLSLISLFLFLIPYTVFFTGIKYFLRYRIVNKVRPFIDAFCAPYKDKYSYWFGARLCLLVVTYIVYGSFRNKAYLILLLQTIILVCFTITQAVIMPYKNNILNILELFYLVDSIIIYIMGVHTSEAEILEITSNIIMAPAFVVFLAIIAYHVNTYILKGKVLGKWFTKLELHSSGSDGNVNEVEGERTSLTSSAKEVSPRATYSAVALDNPQDLKHYLPGELREPLMENDSDHD